MRGRCVGGLGFEQADAYQPAVVMDALDRVSVELEFAQDGGGEVDPAGAQVGKRDRLVAGAAQSLKHPLLLAVSERHRRPVAGAVSGFDAFSVGAQELGPALGGVRGGVGRRDEVLHDVDEASGVVELGEVAGVLEDFEPAAGHGFLGGVPVVDGQYRVALAPDDQRRHVLGEVQAVACVDELPARPDDPAQGAEERRARVWLGERRERARVVLGVGGRTDAQRASGARREIDQRASGRGGEREEELAAGKGGEAKDEADVGTEAAA